MSYNTGNVSSARYSITAAVEALHQTLLTQILWVEAHRLVVIPLLER